MKHEVTFTLQRLDGLFWRDQWLLVVAIVLLLVAVIAWLANTQSALQHNALRLGLTGWPASQVFLQEISESQRLKGELELEPFSRASDLAVALESGRLDGAAIPLSEAFRLADRGLELTVIALLSESSGAHALLCRPASVSSYCSLQWATVGYDWFSEDAQLLQYALESDGLTASAISPVHVQQLQQSATFFRKSTMLNLLAVRQPQLSKMVAQGYRTLWTTDSQHPLFHVLVVHNAAVDKRRGLLKRVVNKWYQRRAASNADRSLNAVESYSRERKMAGQRGIIMPGVADQQRWMETVERFEIQLERRRQYAGAKRSGRSAHLVYDNLRRGDARR